jgi:hypothetical protein
MKKKSSQEREILNDSHKKRNEVVLKEAQEMWKRPLSLEQAKKQVAEVKADMMKDKDRRTH